MNKTAIKNFAIWARNKLIADISYRAGLMGITPNGIHPALPQSTGQTKFYDIGTAEPYAISGEAIRQREHLAELIRRKAEVSGYQTAFKYIIEEVAYTWFNRLIAMRFMEVNDYLPSHIRVLSSDQGKIEPDLVTTPFDADLDFSRDEQQTIIDLKNENKLDEVFRLLFIKQCNALNEILPALFEKTNDYTELLQNLSVVDQDGVVYHLVHDIPEEDFDVERGGQVEIIGWLYQYYNTEPKNAAFAKKGKITKEEIPAVTQLFTPDWIVRYMVENSLGRLWIERNNAQQDYDIGHWEDNNILKSQWKYYLEEAIQELEINERLDEIRKLYRQLNVKDIKIIDPCMGSGHILVYAFDVLMQIYETVGYSQRDAAKTILENNLYGLDIDDRAFQMAYFAVMMKAREYNRRILNGKNRPNLYSIQESNDIDRKQLKFFGRGMEKGEREAALRDMTELFDIFVDAKEYGSILRVKMYDWERLERFATDFENKGQISLESVGLEETSCAMIQMIEQGKCLAQKYEICATNPPYRALSDCSNKLIEYVKKEFPEGKSDLFAVFIIKCRNMTKAHGFYSMITMQSWMFLSSFQTIRKRILENQITSMVHLGSHAFNNDVGTIVQTTAFCIRKSQLNNYIAHYKRLLSAGSSEQKERDFFNRDIKDYFAKNSIYLNIPGEPIVYWCSSDIANLFASNKPLKNLGLFDCGIKTGNNEWFLRGWFEVNYTSVALEPTIEQMESGEYKWFFYNKGGGYCKWYGNTSYVVDLEKDASRIKSLIDASTYRLRNKQNYFVEKLSWPLTGSDRFSCKYIGKRVLADVASNTINIDHLRNWTGLMAYMNSSLYNYMLNMINPTLSYPIESVIAIPLIEVQDEHIDEIVLENIEITKNDWDSKETSWDFKTHPLIDKGLIKDVWQKWNDLCNLRKQQIKNNEEYINASFAKIVDTNVEIEVEEKDILIHQASMSKDIMLLLH